LCLVCGWLKFRHNGLDADCDTDTRIGFAARGDIGPGSNVDLLIEFSRPAGLFHFMEVKDFLEEVLGYPVDLVTRDALKPQLREAILEEAVDAT